MRRPALPPLTRDKADTLLLLATCLLVLTPHLLRLPLWASGFCLLLLAWRGWITFRGLRMPNKWLLLPVAAACGAASWVAHGTLLGRDPGVTMLAMLLTLKLLEMHARRDLFTVMFASYFLLLANFFYSQTIAMAVLMAATVVLVLVTQQTFQYTGTVPPLRTRLRQGATLFALALPVTLVMFVLFPRIQGPLWRLPSDAASGKIGLSDTMTPGNISDLAASDEVAFRATFDGAVPPRAQLYWRGIVLTDFDGRTWTPARRRMRMPADGIRVQWRGAPVRQTITLEPSGKPWLFALDIPQAAPSLPGLRTGINAEVQMLASGPINERLRYEVSSMPGYALQAGGGDLDTSAWLALPAGYNPRTMALAADLRARQRDDAALVNEVLRLFRREPFRYTLAPPLLGVHSVDEFLFDTRAGFCEHYAGSFVVLMRAAGIPARVVTGYQGGEVNPVDGFFTVRQSDAHAWAEVWIAGQGWKRVDPTAAVAPERVERSLGQVLPSRALGGLITLDLNRDTWLGQLRFNWEALNNAWNQLVLSYSVERQNALLRSLGIGQTDYTTWALLLMGLGTAAMGVALLPLLWQRRRPDPLTALYDALCRELARAGIARAAHEGPRTFAARVAAEGGGLEEKRRRAVAEFLALLEALRYARGGHPPRELQADDLARLKTLLNESR